MEKKAETETGFNERLVRVASILADMSANATVSLDRIEKEVSKKIGKWELRLWMLVLIAIPLILEFFVVG
jgi:hypothetical protein